jgi:protein-L-isoaspartate(D-aspartate) O-methyltransferase
MRDEQGARANEALVRDLIERNTIRSASVAAAFRRVPRHHFLPDLPLETVYADQPIALRYDDGIAISSSSQPAMMAEMLELLRLAPGERVLEIGTGSGYNAALLATLVGPSGFVASVDRDPTLVASAREPLTTLPGIVVHLLVGDGVHGDAANAPFDAIEATVGVADVPPPWIAQLREGGRLIVPLAIRSLQKVVAFERIGERLESRAILDGSFMLLRGPSAQRDENALALGDARLTLRVRDHRTVDAPAIARALEQPAEELALARPLSAETLWSGFALWLAVREEHFARLTAMDDTVAERVPNLIPDAGAPGSRTSTLGVALGRELAIIAPTPHGLVVRRIGPDDGAAGRLQSQLIAWHDAGRPGNGPLHLTVIPRTPGDGRPTLPHDRRAYLIEQPSATVVVRWN